MLSIWNCVILVSISILFGISEAKKAPNGSYISEEHRLYKTLMDDYDPSVRPVSRESDTLEVNIAFGVTAVADLDERNQVFTFAGYMRKFWTDAQLVWDPQEFGGIDVIRIPIVKLWYPDITIVNSKDAYYTPPLHHLAVVYNNGKVLWIPPITAETRCTVDLSNFPYDEHVCPVIIMSWSYEDRLVNITSSYPYKNNTEILEPDYHQSSAWKLVSATKERHVTEYKCCPNEKYPDITYYFTLKRQSSFSTHLFLGPSLVLCIITPAIFLLPPGSREKMTLGIGVVIADTLLLGELINFVPSAHPNLPLLAKYFLANIIMASLSLATCAIIIGFFDKSNSRLSGPPAFFRMIILGPVAKFLFVKKEEFYPIDETASSETLEKNADGEGVSGGVNLSGSETETEKRRLMLNYLRVIAKSEWRQLAVVFDRLFFVIYCVVLFILTLAFAC